MSRRCTWIAPLLLLLSSCTLTAIPEQILSGGGDDAGAGVDVVSDAAQSDAGQVDAARADAAIADSTRSDLASPDTAGADSARLDSAAPDSAAADAALADTLLPDGAAPDGAAADAALADTLLPDGAAQADAWVADSAAPDSGLPDQAQPDTARADSGGDPGDNTPPVAIARFTPPVGTTSTTFTTDVSLSYDHEDLNTSLVFSWDWNLDGSFDAVGATQAHTFSSTGDQVVLLDLADSGGLHDRTLVTAHVVAPGYLIEVTTEVDEDDAGATPATPGGSGLSLREAIDHVNGLGGARTIFVPPDLTIALDSDLPSVTTSGVSIIGAANATVDGTGIGNRDCLSVDADNFLVEGLTLRACPATALAMNGSNNRVVSCQFLQNQRALEVMLGSNLTVGPGNLFAQNLDYAILSSAAGEIVGNVFRDNDDYGIRLLENATNTLIAQNVFRRNVSAVGVLGSATGSRVVHNVIDGHSDFAVLVGSRAQAIIIKNNIFSANIGSSVINSGGDDAEIQHNVLFGNAGASCTCGTLDGTNISVDPLYIDPSAEDLRLQPDSPLIDAAVDLGVDVNGSFAGLYNGAAPDIGAYEAP